jgi:Coenzyme PQQ synthesis protein D (PqqD)
MPLRDEQRFSQASDVLSRVLDGEAVLLDLATGKYFGLNPVGTRVWELLGAGHNLGEVRATLLAELDVEAGVLEGDLEELVEELRSRGLIREG